MLKRKLSYRYNYVLSKSHKIQNQMRYYIIFGPPGVGKGTQSKLIAEKYNLKHISTGELLRKEIREGSEIGKMAHDIIGRGELIADDIIFELLKKEVSNINGPHIGFILDGFPRTINQAIALEKMLEEIGNGKLNAIISLEADDEILKQRIMKRATIEGRQDDASPDIISNRIKTYYNQTSPLISFYKERKKYYPIVGTVTIEEAFKEISSVIDNINNE